MNFQELPKNIQQIILGFIEQYKSDSNIIAILLVGSYSYSIPDENSDIDIYIILKESETRERGNLFIDGYEIEYFINPINQVFAYLDQEGRLRPVTAHMLYNGIVLYDNSHDDAFIRLRRKAKEIIELPLPELTSTQIELYRYSFDDARKDLNDTYQSNITGYHMTAQIVISSAITFICEYYRVFQQKSKLLHQQFKSIDNQFYFLLEQIYQSNYEIIQIFKLITYVESLLGGPREKEWKLKGDLTI